MQMKNTALLTGPYDWDAELWPLAEYDARLSTVYRVMDECHLGALLVHGNSIEHGSLAYLTGFTPKLGPAFALVPREGAIRLLVSGGPGMIGSAKRLTWVEDVRPIGNLGDSLSEWLNQAVRAKAARIGLWGGAKLAQRPYLALGAAIQPFGGVVEMEEPLDTLRRRKSARELQLLRESCRILSPACEAFERTVSEGAGARSAALAAERTAFARGAQDVRILASARDGGPPLPLLGAVDIRCAPLLVCVAVRFAGYWAEGLLTVAAQPGRALAHAEVRLASMLHRARPGTTAGELRLEAAQNAAPYKIHPFAHAAIGNGIGLSLEEASSLNNDEKSRLEAGGVYAIRAGALGEGSDAALVSAMIAVTENGSEVLWRTPRVGVR